jgi:hypothetical protein
VSKICEIGKHGGFVTDLDQVSMRVETRKSIPGYDEIFDLLMNSRPRK